MNQLDSIQKRLMDEAELIRHVSQWKMLNHKIIFTNGCFDLLHYGHLALLSKAKDLGGKLVVGVNSDQSVKRLKGENRPIKALEERGSILASLKMVDAVIPFDEDTPINLIKMLEPSFLVKGGDWKKEDVVGADVVEANGGEVVIIPTLEGFSTSGTEIKIRSGEHLGTV